MRARVALAVACVCAACTSREQPAPRAAQEKALALPVDRGSAPRATAPAPARPARRARDAIVVHAIVALCDNTHQGIVKVPAKLGNGQDPRDNLYWGSATGVKTWFSGRRGWEALPARRPPFPVLDRIVVRKRARGRTVVFVADAYDGAHMPAALRAFLGLAAGERSEEVAPGLQAGGYADVAVFVGHNGLMDAPLAAPPARAHDDNPKEAVVLACSSRAYFAPLLRRAGTRALLWTTNLLAPEAYVLEAVLEGKLAGRAPAAIVEAAARAYHRWQKCGLRGAGRLFASEL